MRHVINTGILPLLFAAIIAIGFFLYQEDTLPPTEVRVETTESFEEQFARYEKHLVSLVTNENPSVALGELAHLMKDQSFVLNNCHELLHEIGYTSYDKYQDFAEAISYQDDICNSGYYHGVIEQYFGTLDSVLPAMEQVCEGETLGTLPSWECYHGVGHGFMFYSGNDVETSVGYCENYETLFQKDACINGVYMEVFNLDEETRERALPETKEALVYCDQTLESGRKDCFSYAPTYYLLEHPDHFQDMFSWCEQAVESDKQACLLGAGSELLKRNLHDPAFVEATCIDSTNEHLCLTGAVSQAMFHLADTDEVVNSVCGSWSIDNQLSCIDLAQSIAQTYQIQ